MLNEYEETLKKTLKAVVIHSGGMDSSLCLALAMQDFGREYVISLSFRYEQRHSIELTQAAAICRDWRVDHVELDLSCLAKITANALVNPEQAISHPEGELPNTLVVGRNGLMAKLGGIYAKRLGARCLYMGVIEVEGANSGYRDCNRHYMNLIEETLKIDLDDSNFEIRTPVIRMTKKETLELAHRMGILRELLEKTITCYEGIPHAGCLRCPACHLRNEGILQFLAEHPDFPMPYSLSNCSG